MKEKTPVSNSFYANLTNMSPAVFAANARDIIIKDYIGLNGDRCFRFLYFKVRVWTGDRWDTVIFDSDKSRDSIYYRGNYVGSITSSYAVAWLNFYLRNINSIEMMVVS